MSVVERALKRLQSKSSPQSVRGQRPVAKVSRGLQRASSGAGGETIVGQGRVVEFSISALSEAGLYSDGNSRLADEYRLIKQPIIKKATTVGEVGNPRGNLIMVASAFGGEGKTFTSVNLSLSLAREKDLQVLLVDVDCKNPQLSRLLGVDEEPGLMDFLKDPSASVESLVMPTNVPSLSVLPIGSRDDHATEYLGSLRMGEFCERFATIGQRQLVVFDSSPLLLTPEASILSDQVGQVLLVVLANMTPRQALMDAIEKIDRNVAVGLVLNRVGHGEDVFRYGNYNQYGHES